jgi:sugar phosphate isomerase/epimerase
VNIQYAISLWNFSHYARVDSLEEELHHIRECGCGVELWRDRFPEIQNIYSKSLRMRLKQALGDLPVSLHTARVHGFAEHRTQVDIAHDLGAHVVVVHPDEFFADGPGTLDVALCRDLVAYATESGVRIALENVVFDDQLPFLEQAIEAVDGLKICLDVGHVYRTDWPLCDYLTTLKSHIAHLHLEDTLSPAEIGSPAARPEHYTPGSGGIAREDWELLVATLVEIGFDGMAVFEIRPRNPYQTASLGMRFIDGLVCGG